MANELRDLVRALEGQGFVVIKAKRRGHLRVELDGRRVATLALTPSDHRSRKNVISALKRAGFQPDSKFTQRKGKIC
jgi:predicted RNA binding protein YcfA (HicA-like mRNA interferase family)